jgi:CheY-like chemotaxis protein
MHILVVDDDLSIGTAIHAMLSRESCEVVFVQEGALGVRACENASFDVVLVDIFMPGMDGFETIEAIRQQNPIVPIIVMSGFRFRPNGSAPDFMTMAVKLGATHCLPKPFRPRQLKLAINACRDCAPVKILPPISESDQLRGEPR